MEQFSNRSSQSNVNDSGHLKRFVHHAEEHVAATQRSYFELPAPVVVGALLLGGVVAKNDDKDLTFATFAIFFLLYAFHVVREYVSARRRQHATRSDEPDAADATG